MSKAWKRAKELIDSLENYPRIVKEVELKRVAETYKQGDFKPDLYLAGENENTPDLIGMWLGGLQPLLSKERYDKLLSLAKERDLRVKVDEGSRRVWLYTRDKKRVGYIDNTSFATADSQLFEEIGIKLYGFRKHPKLLM
ncbi:MAG: hypothetical protein QMD36_06165 [Candidatus Aenigmarchaeota archaeon]|nr:hypothetical protein [Candidatus Aenigmarchaeota archaeon]